VQRTAADPNRFAQDLFGPLPRRYDVLEELLSFGQNARWRREMVAHVDGADRARCSTWQRGLQASHSS
jgi:demethylmenaquinone methyltransferase/2-methoxy-6-polyprenyl-1,4-benzoquinol methylase